MNKKSIWSDLCREPISKIGRKHYTNGIVEIFIKGECPEGFWPGRIGWKKES